MSIQPGAINDQSLRKAVAEYYGRILASSADLKTNACCAAGSLPQWIAARLANVSQTRFARFFEVTGPRDVHFGVFPCGPTTAAARYDRSSGKFEAPGCC